MTDTSPEVERVYREMLLARSGAERLRMGFEMFSLAGKLVLASLLAEGQESLRERLFLRIYGPDYPPDERARIEEALRRAEEASE